MKNPIIALLLVALGVITGCATAPKSRPAPPSAVMRSGLGRIAIVVPESGITFTSQPPATKLSGALVGTGIGAGAGAGIGAAAAPFGGPLAGVFIGLGVVCGGILGCDMGMETGVSAKEAEGAMSIVTNLCTTPRFEEVLRERLIATATNDAGCSFVLILSGEFFGPSQTENYRQLAAQGVNTVWETTVAEFQLRGRFAPALSVRARTKLIQLPQGTELYSYEEVFHGQTACKLPVWADNHAALLLKETQQGAQAMSEMLVEQLFLRAPEPATNPVPRKVENEN